MPCTFVRSHTGFTRRIPLDRPEHEVAYCEFRPEGALSPYVRCFWAMTHEAAATGGRRRAFETFRSPAMLAEARGRYTTELLPDGSVEIAFQLGDPVFECPRGEPPRRLPDSLIWGQLTGPVTLAPSGFSDTIGIRFRPAGASVFTRADMRALRDRFAPLAQVWPALAGLSGPLVAARTFPARVCVLEDALEALLLRGVVGWPDPAVFRAVDLLEATAGARRIDEVADRLHVSGRRLLRLFNRHVGISPKLLARILRFQRVFSALQVAPDASWRGLALEAGYYDQAHLVREFRVFAGTTPEAFLREWREVVAWLERDAA